jgi:hypothetical protein
MPPDVDDGSISNDAGLLRRIHPRQVIHDKNRGAWRPMSGAFKDKEMSVDAEPILHQHGLSSMFSLRNSPGFSLVRFLAGEARALQLAVVHKPRPDDQPDNPAHTEVLGATDANARHFAAICAWVHLGPERP